MNKSFLIEIERLPEVRTHRARHFKACVSASSSAMMRTSIYNRGLIMIKMVPVIFAMAASLLLGGCVHMSDFSPVSSLPEPSNPADRELMPGSLSDPIEPVNRVFFAIDETLFTLVVEPTTRGYNKVIPKPARTGLKNFRKNLFYPVRLGNNALQGKWSNVGTETKRFLINTTVGVLGFGDPASKKFNLDPADEDLGQTLGTWGWNKQTYLYLPFLGAGSGRDLLGRGGDFFMDPASLIPEAKMGLEFNLLSFDAKTTREILETEFDPYTLNKMFYTQRRALKVIDAQPVEESEDTAQTQTMEALFSRPDNSMFARLATVGFVQPEGFRTPMPYSLWPQDHHAPIAFVLPGLGGHRLNTRALALAELAHLEGYHVVCFSNNLNWEFIRSAPEGYLPGFLDDDLKYIRQLQTAVQAGLNTELGANRIIGKPAIMGFSMGGWYTLNLAATNPPDTFGHALSINPPLDLTIGLKALDRLFRAPANNPNRATIMQSALLKMLINNDSVPGQGFKSPYSDLEASYVIGLSYRLTLRQTIMTSHNLRPGSNVINHVNAFSYDDYFKKIMTPRLADRNITEANLAASSDLRTREAGLMAAPNLKLVLTSNDFLLTQDNLAWFRDKFGERVIYSEKGGHMGHIWKPEVKAKMREAIRWKIN